MDLCFIWTSCYRRSFVASSFTRLLTRGNGFNTRCSLLEHARLKEAPIVVARRGAPSPLSAVAACHEYPQPFFAQPSLIYVSTQDLSASATKKVARLERTCRSYTFKLPLPSTTKSRPIFPDGSPVFALSESAPVGGKK